MIRKISLAVLIILCVLWTGFIFSNSLETAEVSGEKSSGITEKVNEVAHAVGIEKEITQSDVRDMAHFSEFAVLSALLSATVAVGIYPHFKRRLIPMLSLSAVSLPASFILACIDELLQKLSDGRASQFSDVLLDTLGAFTGAVGVSLVILLIYFIANKKKSE